MLAGFRHHGRQRRPKCWSGKRLRHLTEKPEVPEFAARIFPRGEPGPETARENRRNHQTHKHLGIPCRRRSITQKPRSRNTGSSTPSGRRWSSISLPAINTPCMASTAAGKSPFPCCWQVSPLMWARSLRRQRIFLSERACGSATSMKPRRSPRTWKSLSIGPLTAFQCLPLAKKAVDNAQG